MPDRDHTSHGRFRYGPWRGGPDPLAPPYDVRAALDEVGRDVLAGGGLGEALRELLRRGMDGRAGLDELAERVRRMRQRARRRGDLAGTLDHVRAALDQALAAERDTLAGRDDDTARLAEMELATLPDDTAGQVRALADYDWQSPEARAAYESIRDMQLPIARVRGSAPLAAFVTHIEAGHVVDREWAHGVSELEHDLVNPLRQRALFEHEHHLGHHGCAAAVGGKAIAGARDGSNLAQVSRHLHRP